MKTSPLIEEALKNYLLKGIIKPRTENNPYLKVSYHGAGGLISPKWNIKIYTSGTIVCNEINILNGIINGSILPPDSNLKLIQIDDAGVGFPLLGAMVGVTDGQRVVTGVIDVSYFKPGIFERKEYLQAYADKGVEILMNDFKATTTTHRIEICTGFINTALKARLEALGFDVRIAEIKGLLQDSLERLFKEYVKKELENDLYYDPKKFGSSQEISRAYYKTVEWAQKNAPHLLKSGWKSMRGN